MDIVGLAYQLKVTVVFASRIRPTLDPLQMVTESSFSNSNGGFTVTAIVCASPVQLPIIEVGVTL
jgi:hypothetical protein